MAGEVDTAQEQGAGEVQEQSTVEQNINEIDKTLEEVGGGGTDEEIGTETEKEEKKGFNPEELEFEESYTFGEYDLSKFKEDLKLDDENFRNTLTTVAGEMKEKGFTQEQIEWIIEREIASAREKAKFEELDPEQTKIELQKGLTTEERRNYKAVAKFTKEIIGNDEKMMEGYDEMMSNPYVVKLLNKAYLHSLGGKSINTPKVNKEVKEKPLYTIDDIRKKIKDYSLNSKTIDKIEFKKVLSSWIKNSENPEKAKEEFNNYFNW